MRYAIYNLDTSSKKGTGWELVTIAEDEQELDYWKAQLSGGPYQLKYETLTESAKPSEWVQVKTREQREKESYEKRAREKEQLAKQAVSKLEQGQQISPAERSALKRSSNIKTVRVDDREMLEPEFEIYKAKLVGERAQQTAKKLKFETEEEAIRAGYIVEKPVIAQRTITKEQADYSVSKVKPLDINTKPKPDITGFQSSLNAGYETPKTSKTPYELKTFGIGFAKGAGELITSPAIGFSKLIYTTPIKGLKTTYGITEPLIKGTAFEKTGLELYKKANLESKPPYTEKGLLDPDIINLGLVTGFGIVGSKLPTIAKAGYVTFWGAQYIETVKKPTPEKFGALTVLTLGGFSLKEKPILSEKPTRVIAESIEIRKTSLPTGEKIARIEPVDFIQKIGKEEIKGTAKGIAIEKEGITKGFIELSLDVKKGESSYKTAFKSKGIQKGVILKGTTISETLIGTGKPIKSIEPFKSITYETGEFPKTITYSGKLTKEIKTGFRPDLATVSILKKAGSIEMPGQKPTEIYLGLEKRVEPQVLKKYSPSELRYKIDLQKFIKSKKGELLTETIRERRIETAPPEIILSKEFYKSFKRFDIKYRTRIGFGERILLPSTKVTSYDKSKLTITQQKTMPITDEQIKTDISQKISIIPKIETSLAIFQKPRISVDVKPDIKIKSKLMFDVTGSVPTPKSEVTTIKKGNILPDVKIKASTKKETSVIKDFLGFGKSQYVSSPYSVVFDIWGRKPKRITGLEARPLLRSWKKGWRL